MESLRLVKLVVFIFFLIEGTSGLCQAECLKEIRSGKFVHYSNSDTTLIIREANTQQQIFNGGKSTFISEIYWLSNDEYHATLIEKNNSPGAFPPIGAILKVRIVRCNSKYYDCSIEYQGKEMGVYRYFFFE